ncbi:MAG: hypothetical protein RXN92_00755 [Thermoplasmatales archaeon]
MKSFIKINLIDLSISKDKAIIAILIESIVVYFVVSMLILGPLFEKFYTGNPGKALVPFATSYISLGIAVAYFTIAMVIYPIIKNRERGVLNE